MDRKKLIYIGIVLIVSVIVSITYFSYAFFTRTDEFHGKLNIVAGTLNYKLSSTNLNSNNQITLAANEIKEIEVKITSLNDIGSKYKMFLNNNNVLGATASSETISSNQTKTIKLLLENTSNSNQTVTVGIKGGFTNKTVELSNNEIEVHFGNDNVTQIVSGFTNLSEVLLCDRVGENEPIYYNCAKSTFDNAISSKDRSGIIMTQTLNNVSKKTIASGKNIVLELNGKEINSVGVNETSTTYNGNNQVFAVNGKVIINDNIGTGGVYTGYNGDAFQAYANSNMIINGGTFKGRIALYVSGNNSYTEINGGTFEGLYYEAVSLTGNCSDCKMIINNGNFNNNDNYVGIFLNASSTGEVDINNGNFQVTNTNELYNLNSPIAVYEHANNNAVLNIKDGMFRTVGYAIRNTSSASINITGGTFICTNTQSCINNIKDGIININQTDKKIYIANLLVNNSWVPTVYNSASSENGKVNISGNKANICDDNYNHTTSGLCVYSKTAAVVNAIGVTTVDGGSYVNYGKDTTGVAKWPAIEVYSGVLKIRNANISSENVGVGTSSQGGTANLCNSKVSGLYDLRTLSSNSAINYSSNVTFTNNTNSPSISTNSGTITKTDNACTW